MLFTNIFIIDMDIMMNSDLLFLQVIYSIYSINPLILTDPYTYQLDCSMNMVKEAGPHNNTGFTLHES